MFSKDICDGEVFKALKQKIPQVHSKCNFVAFAELQNDRLKRNKFQVHPIATCNLPLRTIASFQVYREM